MLYNICLIDIIIDIWVILEVIYSLKIPKINTNILLITKIEINISKIPIHVKVTAKVKVECNQL